MKKSANETLFLLILAGAALFVVRTGGTLPAVIATHFGPSGVAIGFMPRTLYVRFMLIFVVVLPLALNFLISRVLRLPNTRVNVPHRDYWLAPERRAVTVELLQRHMKFFGVLLAAFLCYVHWLVVQANRLALPALDNTRFAYGLSAFMVALITWTVVLRRNFRPPRP